PGPEDGLVAQVVTVAQDVPGSGLRADQHPGDFGQAEVGGERRAWGEVSAASGLPDANVLGPRDPGSLRSAEVGGSPAECRM
ncbi:hypothetical protein NGM37_09215, partial [Streptomyces sp. TRM76130]|nr:hypothetical protein [Streptomyces sp. TRM76130]